MQSKNLIPFNELNIYELLKTIRNFGLIRPDETRLIMNAIVGSVAEWKRPHCREFFRALLNHYLEDIDLERLLATSGYGEGYDNKFVMVGKTPRRNNASSRRQRYKDLNPGEAELPSLNNMENRKLMEMAEAMKEDYANGELLAILVRVIPPAELMELGLSKLVPEAERRQYRESEEAKKDTNETNVPFPIYHVRRSLVPDFMSREDVLAVLSTGFSDKHKRKTMILSGMAGIGKTQTAIRFAESAQNEYDAVLFLDATNAETLEQGVELFLSIYDPNYLNETNVSLLTAEAGESTDTPTEVGKNKMQRNGTSVPLIAISFQKFISSLLNRKLLIIYDNADYLDGAEQDAEVKRQILSSYMPDGNCHILITTRCNVPFNNGELVNLQVFTPEEAAEYLTKKTGLSVCHETGVLAERLGYLPLALSYAGAYIKEHLSSYQEYLELWDTYGLSLFDNPGYTETTVRKAIRLTLDKLNPTRESGWLAVLECAVGLGGEYFVPEAYVKMRKLDEVSVDDFPEQDREFLTALIDPLERNRTMHFLASHSLIQWDGKRMYLHPLLKEIIADDLVYETPLKIKKLVKGLVLEQDFRGLMEMYRIAGDEALAVKYGQMYAHVDLVTLESAALLCEDWAEEGKEVDYGMLESELAYKGGVRKKNILKYGSEEDKQKLKQLEKLVRPRKK